MDTARVLVFAGCLFLAALPQALTQLRVCGECRCRTGMAYCPGQQLTRLPKLQSVDASTITTLALQVIMINQSINQSINQTNS